MGRCKIEIKRIKNPIQKKITFFRRRRGLLKKAEELAILCDAELGLVVFSSSGELCDYSSTEMEPLIKKYLNYKTEQAENEDSDNNDSDNNHFEENSNGVQLPETPENFPEAKGQEETASLNNSHGQLKGEDLDCLDSSSLQVLENLLESNLQTVRLKKEQLFINENQKLKQTALELQQRNINLLRMINDIRMQNYKLFQKVNELREKSTGTSSAGTELRETIEDTQVCWV